MSSNFSSSVSSENTAYLASLGAYGSIGGTSTTGTSPEGSPALGISPEGTSYSIRGVFVAYSSL